MSIDQTLTYKGRVVPHATIAPDGKPTRTPNVWIIGGARGMEEADHPIFVADIFVTCDQNDRYGIVEFNNPITGGMENRTVTTKEPFQLEIRTDEGNPGTLTWTHVPEMGIARGLRR